ncbi:hypothetical protein SUDANB105_07019 [Streptomyces sp. enrichment culture]|uniref:hypothetical protein n=1 Tax=Streptomyces sp. enrichment culture TaxID=1795815 RepID=UPI003F579D8F
MRTSFKIHAGLQLGLGAAVMLIGALTFVAGAPAFTNTGLSLGVTFAFLVPLHAATIFRGIALDFRSGGSVSNKSLQWSALRALPHSVHVCLVALGLGGAALLAAAQADEGSLSGGEAHRGHYYAVDTSDPYRTRIEITRSEYDDLRKQNQRTMVAVFGLIAAGGGTLTLVIAELDAASRLPTPPASERP